MRPGPREPSLLGVRDRPFIPEAPNTQEGCAQHPRSITSLAEGLSDILFIFCGLLWSVRPAFRPEILRTLALPSFCERDRSDHRTLWPGPSAGQPRRWLTSSSQEPQSRHSVSLLSVWLKSCPHPTCPNEREEPAGLLRKCGSGTGAQDRVCTTASW